ncbi:hypothetical protein Nepgr_020551 [Nepenthes gracilis]|uniref:Uncharacterized protein n=1 Tax=Nepenthes gracilis TaxID=150966 RepID=A0AAD3SVI7_NEPGR|nr:hypothetical protein Nepgr_020551 [Nepenthes gracilis]
MIIFALKALNILPLLSCAKATLNHKMVDPFLDLTRDNKLQSIDKKSERSAVIFGSGEDDSFALRCQSEIQMTGDETRESMVSIIVSSLENLSDSELCASKKQLLSELLPDDVRPLGAELLYQFGSRDGSRDEAALIFSIDDDDDDDLLNLLDCQAKKEIVLAMEILGILGVDWLLE